MTQPSLHEGTTTVVAQQLSYVDDLNGAPATRVGLRFSVEDEHYQIDLSEENYAKLRDSLAPFIAHARKAGAVDPDARTDQPARTRRTQQEVEALRDQALTMVHQGVSRFQTARQLGINRAIVARWVDEEQEARQRETNDPATGQATGPDEAGGAPADDDPTEGRPDGPAPSTPVEPEGADDDTAQQPPVEANGLAVTPEVRRAIRQWAKRKGRTLSPHGRIPRNVIEEYTKYQNRGRKARTAGR